MTAEQARLFADYILGMEKSAGESYLKFSAFRLDDTFFEELGSMINEAEAAGDGRRQAALERLQAKAQEACGRALAQFEDLEETPAPKTDYEKGMRLIELDQRVTSMMMRVWSNPVTDDIIADWKKILNGYLDLLKAGDAPSSFYTLESLQVKVAETVEAIARAYASKRDTASAARYFRDAALEFEKAGRVEGALRCRHAAAAGEREEEGDLDGKIQSVLKELDRLEPGSVAYCARLVDLGELQSQGGDDFAAEKTLLEVESYLKSAGFRNPSGTEFADALMAAVQGADSNYSQNAVASLLMKQELRSVYQRLHFALARVYQGLDFKGNADKAQHHMKLAENMDSQEMNDEFSQRMLKSLAAGLGDMFRY
jgi:hypothetical protein